MQAKASFYTGTSATGTGPMKHTPKKLDLINNLFISYQPFSRIRWSLT